MEEKKLSVGVKIGYGVADFGGNLFFTATAFVLLNYLTDTVGLSAALAGIALMVGRIWDAFYDPIIGYISDRTKTKMGRRRPFMLGGSIPLFIAMIIMFTNPTLVIGAGISQTVLFVYTMVVYIILCTAYSTVNIPYSSLGPELTNDYNERTSLNGYRFGFAGIGTLLGTGLALPIVAMAPDKNLGFVLMGTIFGAVLLVSTLTTVFSVRESAVIQPAMSIGFWETYREVFKNKPYLLILLSYIFFRWLLLAPRTLRLISRQAALRCWLILPINPISIQYHGNGILETETLQLTQPHQQNLFRQEFMM